MPSAQYLSRRLHLSQASQRRRSHNHVPERRQCCPVCRYGQAAITVKDIFIFQANSCSVVNRGDQWTTWSQDSDTGSLQRSSVLPTRAFSVSISNHGEPFILLSSGFWYGPGPGRASAGFVMRWFSKRIMARMLWAGIRPLCRPPGTCLID